MAPSAQDLRDQYTARREARVRRVKAIQDKLNAHTPAAGGAAPVLMTLDEIKFAIHDLIEMQPVVSQMYDDLAVKFDGGDHATEDGHVDTSCSLCGPH